MNVGPGLVCLYKGGIAQAFEVDQVEFLMEPQIISGKWIPIIPFYGYRSYVDGTEWSRGLVRKLKDAARLFNMQVSQLAENAASAGQEVPILLREQMESPDVQELWANKNNKPYLVIDAARDIDGNIVSAGPVAYSKPPQLDGSTAALLQIVPQFVQDTTGGVPQETLDPDMSGKAIRALMEREDLTTGKVTKNLKDAIEHSGVVYQGMAAEVYNKPRIIRTIGKDGKESESQITSFVEDEENPGTIIEVNKLSGKKFRAYADIGPQYDTLREQTVEDLKGMLEAMKDIQGGERYTSALIGVLLENISGVGLDPIKELNRRLMLTEGIIKPETPEEEAMLQQMQQQSQQPDPQQVLLEAAANQQNAEARSLDSASVQKIADARKKEAETLKITSDIDLDEKKQRLDTFKLLDEQRRETIEQVEALPVG